MNPLHKSTSPLLQFSVAALVLAVLVADFVTPLGVAVWVFYALPLGFSLFSRQQALPLIVAGVATAGTVLSLIYDPFETEAVVKSWVGLLNRGMYVATLWPFAFMVRQLIVVREVTEREAWLREAQATVLASLQGDLEVREIAERVLDGSARAVGAVVGALYLDKQNGELERIATHALDGDATPATFRHGEGLVGAVAAGGPVRLLDSAPEGFLRVQAGVGAGAPGSVAIAPLRNENRTVAVLALGALRDFEEEASEPDSAAATMMPRAALKAVPDARALTLDQMTEVLRDRG